MAKYQKYTEYKDSGIEWLGEIPNHWNVGNLKFSFVGIKNGATETQIEESNNTVPISRIESISTGEINYEKVGFVNKYSIAESYKINEGDILLSHINSLSMVGNIALKRDTSILYHGMNLLRLMPNKDKFDPKYLFWILKSKYFRNSVESIAKPAINQASVSIDSLKNISLLIPTKIEQQDIANFLDHETAKIDTLIAKQEKLIELLKEKRQAVISNLVAVQNNEPTIKLKYAVEILAGYSFSSAGFQIENDNGIPLLRGINVGVGSIRSLAKVNL
ncbi:restriction endonuclease subunit S [Acinetobacter baumannii]|uniref:restriction endonuclease subunit S n=1 Tax=Acinetobacter baumannii TaxID=470 RepID=UPI0038928332